MQCERGTIIARFGLSRYRNSKIVIVVTPTGLSAGLIHFAGTETAVENYGTMCGAVESGQRAAIEALEELKPQCLSSR